MRADLPSLLYYFSHPLPNFPLSLRSAFASLDTFNLLKESERNIVWTCLIYHKSALVGNRRRR